MTSVQTPHFSSEIKPQIVILTIFPEAVEAFLNSSILRRAQLKNKVELVARNLRDFGVGAHKVVDDTPFGGGQGMLFKPDVVDAALASELAHCGGKRENLKVLYTTPRGIQLSHSAVLKLAEWLGNAPGAKMASPESSNPKSSSELADVGVLRKIVILCGRYEGVDERILQNWVDLEFSLGDFILSGGEIASLALLDAIVRLLPGVLGDDRSAREDSFSNGLLEFPHYTKPRDFQGDLPPVELLNGNHKDIERRRLSESLAMTFALRPDLIEAHSGEGLPDWAQQQLKRLKSRL